MAASPSHELGELIGNFFEDVMKSPIRTLCNKYQVYFDSIELRPARNSKKVTWTDINGSRHDLDYVIERNGTPNKIGEPIGFIELAWRRYTKHSKNKAQEIAGAVIPIAQKYHEFAPFLGAILSGVFTDSSIKQLKAQGFHVLYIPFEKVVASFKRNGINIFYDESTQEKTFTEIVKKLKSCDSERYQKIKMDFIETNGDAIKEFMDSFEHSLRRRIKSVFILPLHGSGTIFDDLLKAIDYVSDYGTMAEDMPLDRIVIRIDFNDSSCIQCEFKEKEMALDFLKRNGNDYMR